MKGFIEVTDREGREKVTLNLTTIRKFQRQSLIEDSFTSIRVNDQQFGCYMIVEESYEEVKELIKQATT